MNKMLIVLLAVCLVSTQAFVKRDAPPAVDASFVENMQKKLQDFSKDFNSQMASTFDVEAMKKNLNELANSVNKAMADMKAKPAA
ncbi:hypothetical protein PYW07_016648 [Mythimna separata]|uniref:Uncharacterized protein n=1 Tax=Mythimna separata TaxID=271217 RepID=A0AAD7YKZ7_MYTSE|nr:hypothetical protein PYW07_016648 [Mythimna separata]